MQVAVQPVVLAPALGEAEARRIIDDYLAMYIGVSFRAADGAFVPLDRPIWQFAIRFHIANLGDLGVIGTIDVDAEVGTIIPLTDAQIESLQDRANAILLHQKATNPAAMRPGIDVSIPLLQIDKRTARETANNYLHRLLGDQFTAVIGELVLTGHPVWMFDVRYRPNATDVSVICVSAISGNVVPLNNMQIQEIHERVTCVVATL